MYDLGQQVAASYSCKDEDGGSGLATCSGTVGNGENVDTSSVGEKSFSVSATDNAGNPASKTVTYRVVDRVAPEITLTSPSDGAVYSLGQHVPAAYSCVDQPGGSGLAKCDGTVANGADIDTIELRHPHVRGACLRRRGQCRREERHLHASPTTSTASSGR